MSFSTAPKGAPTIAKPATATSTSAADARARAIAMLSKPEPAPANTQEHPVQNPSKVSVEEMSAVTTPSIGQTKVSEDPKPAEAPAATTQEPPLSAQYAQLARKEKALRAKAQEVKARETALLAQEQAARTPAAPSAPDFKERLKADPIAALNEAGITWDQLTSAALNQPNAAEIERLNYIKKIEAKLEALEAGQNKVAKTFEDSQTQQYTQAVNQIRYEAKALVKSDPSFELVNATNSVDDVVDLIKRTFEADGTLLTVEEAAREVEEHLTEEASKLFKVKKIQQRFQSAAPSAQAPKQTETAKQPQQVKTLTNSVGTSGKLSARDRAILAFSKGKV